MNVFQLADQFRSNLLKRDAKSLQRLLDAYAIAWRAIERDLEKLLAKIQTARDNGEEITEGWLIRQTQLTNLKDQTSVVISKLADTASAITQQDQSAVVAEAQLQAAKLIEAALGPAPEG